MINCSICNTNNHHLSVTCSSCGGYIQHTVDNLNLFETLWKMVEHPQKAFHAIAIAKHKNYIYFLAALAGYAFVAGIFWYINAGDIAKRFIEIIAAGLFISPIVGIIIYFLHLFYIRIVLKAFGYKTKFRNLKAVIAYSLFPLIISALFILPVEIIVFGQFLFMKSPSPFLLQPSSAYFLFGMDILLFLWFFMFYVIGIKILLDIKYAKSMLISILSIGITALTIIGGLSLIPVQ